MIEMRTKEFAVSVIMAHLIFFALFVSCAKKSTGQKTRERAKAEALNIIAARNEWPNSPEEVCKVFWEARRAKNYKEMEILWPGSASWEKDWSEICKDDSNVQLVFGKADESGTEVPYASEEYFNKNGSYNLTMRLSSIQIEKGRRYYIVSGN